MSNQVTKTEEVMGVSSSDPTVVRTTTSTAVPVVGDNPQKVFQQKKVIFQFNKVVWYIVGVIETLLLARFVLKIITTGSSGFVNFIYDLSEVFVIPFKGIMDNSISGNATFEWATIIAMIVIGVLALLIVYLIDLARPVAPQEIRDSE